VAEKALMHRFKGGREGTLWYYRSLISIFRSGGSTPLVDELDRVVSELDFMFLPSIPSSSLNPSTIWTCEGGWRVQAQPCC
jgi:hypothetical protein